MRARNLFLCLIAFLGSQFAAEAYGQSFYRQAIATVDTVNQQIIDCGLFIVSPNEPGLPRQQVPAIAAIRNFDRRLLAYYDEESFGVNIFVYKNPDGGMRHSVQFDQDHIKFVTPYQGTVAQVNLYRDQFGDHYRYFCRGRPTTVEDFQVCVQRDFIDLISQQLCRYAPL